MTGTNLSGTTKVLFGTQAATAITTVSGTQPGATSPAESPGDRNIYVVTPAGTSAATPADGYYFEPPSPTVTAVSPRSGSSLGGTTVTITGTNVDGGVSTRVHFGLTTATGVKIISNTELTAVAPSHAAGLINVEVTTSGGTSVPSSADWFTYTTTTPIPFVSSLSPVACRLSPSARRPSPVVINLRRRPAVHGWSGAAPLAEPPIDCPIDSPAAESRRDRRASPDCAGAP